MNRQLALARGSKIVAGILGVFGLITLAASSSILFDIGGMAAKAGEFVPLVVWMNFCASFLYLIAAYGLITRKRWAPVALVIAVVLLLVAAIGFYFHLRSGGAYEQRTVGALAFRILATMLLYAGARHYTRRSTANGRPQHFS